MDRGCAEGGDIAGRVMAAVPGLHEAMARHPSARRVQAEGPQVVPDVQVDIERRLIVLSTWEDGCGNGLWCQRCRQEIREEALRWIRELNTPEAVDRPERSIPSRPWHPELLLGGA